MVSYPRVGQYNATGNSNATVHVKIFISAWQPRGKHEIKHLTKPNDSEVRLVKLKPRQNKIILQVGAEIYFEGVYFSIYALTKLPIDP